MSELKNCSRCVNLFENEETERKLEIRQFLTKTYFKYLCNNCISELDKMFSMLSMFPSPAKGETLIENIHYYVENGLWVFTEFYHFSRGNCCQNGCRNCAYGYKNKIKF